MYKLLFLLFVSSVSVFGTIHAVVSILPQQTFVQAIGGDRVFVSLMVLPGDSPHTYEPKPSQMKAIAKADVYFAIEVEFEHTWLPKFQDLNPKMRTVSLSEGIEKYSISASSSASFCTHEGHGHHGHEKHLSHEKSMQDPHIWTAPHNVKRIVQNIYEALISLDPKHTAYYKKNLERYLQTIEDTDTQIKALLSTLKESRTFMVFHPSWGYFAREYHLTQLSVEVEGKSPKPKALIALIKQAKKHKVKALFSQTEFSDASAKIIAKEVGIPVIKVSPLAENWAENLISIAEAIAGKK
ncbi:MAG: zinc ABC transporter substrate-binding protein [Sulfurovum sp.]|nr:zinc ABC transporter substrate-binding protein [Sulfurovum sp.]